MIFAGRLFKPAVTLILAGQTVVNLDGEGLRVAFEVQRSLTSEPDTCSVSIYGLLAERSKAMHAVFGELGKVPLQLSAGYDGAVIQLFAGDVRKMRAGRRMGSDVVTQAWADDGGDAIIDVNLTWSTAGVDARTMIDIALGAFAAKGQPIAKHPSVETTIAGTSPEATVQYWTAVKVGRATQILDEAARLLGARWFIRNGLLYMVKRQVPTDGIAVALPRSVWLTEVEDDGSGLSRLSVLMDPNIEPGRPVIVDGVTYRCEAMTSRGDTRSGPWSSALAMRRSA